MIVQTIMFYIFAALAVAAGVLVVSARNPVHSVLFLIVAFFNAAGLFVLIGAEFLAMILVIVYVGAVAVLFLFVVMMLDIDFAQLRGGFVRYLPIGTLVGLILLAELVLGIGTSHTPMLMAPAEDWPRIIDRDGVREFLDKDGRPSTYEELWRRAKPHVAAELTPERFAARHSEAQAGVDYLKNAVRRAELDALIVVGDDHKELYQDDNLPGFVVYHGQTIRNVPLNGFSGPEWARRAGANAPSARLRTFSAWSTRMRKARISPGWPCSKRVIPTLLS